MGVTTRSGASWTPAGPLFNVFMATTMTVAWMFLSTALIIMNKKVYQLGFTFPFFVTGIGQLLSCVGGFAMVKMGLAPLRPVPPKRVWLFKLLPVIISTSATMFFGNASYLTLSVSFIQILKAFTPALTLVLCVGAGLERMTWPLMTSIMLIALGTSSAVLVESGSQSFHIWGLLNFMASSVTEAMRVVGAEILLGSSRYNSAEALIYIGGPTSILLLLCSAFWEGAAIMSPVSNQLNSGAVTERMLSAAVPTNGLELMAHHPTTFLLAFLLSFLVNLSCFFAIQYTSSLTFKVAGCLKNIAVVWYGVVAHGERVTASQLLGYALSVSGFVLYSYLKSSSAPRKRSSSRTSSSRNAGGGDAMRMSTQSMMSAAGTPHPNDVNKQKVS